MAGFRLWLWTMLAVIALSAAPTGAQPRTQAIGSAFDPATTSVALTSKRQHGQQAASERRDDTPASPAIPVVFSWLEGRQPLALVPVPDAIEPDPVALPAAPPVHELALSLAPRGPPAS